MPYEVSYTQGTPEELDKRAIRDMYEYLGLKAFRILWREEIKKVQTMQDLDSLDRVLQFCGVSGRPILACFRRKWGAALVEKWRTVKRWDAVPIADILEELKPRAPSDVQDYLQEGNNKADLIDMLWEKMSERERNTLIKEVADFHREMEQYNG